MRKKGKRKKGADVETIAMPNIQKNRRGVVKTPAEREEGSRLKSREKVLFLERKSNRSCSARTDVTNEATAPRGSLPLFEKGKIAESSVFTRIRALRGTRKAEKSHCAFLTVNHRLKKKKEALRHADRMCNEMKHRHNKATVKFCAKKPLHILRTNPVHFSFL